jgi:hypothetical protein
MESKNRWWLQHYLLDLDLNIRLVGALELALSTK